MSKRELSGYTGFFGPASWEFEKKPENGRHDS